MVLYCFVEKCKSKKYKKGEMQDESNLQFYGFPSCPDIRKKWVEALLHLNKQESALRLPKSSRICSLHFSSGCFEQNGFSSIRLKPHSIPSIFPRGRKESLEISSKNHDDKENLTQNVEVINPIENLETSIENRDDIEILSRDIDNTVPMKNLDTSVENHEKNENLSQDIEDACPVAKNGVEANCENSTERILKTPKRVIRYPGDIDENVLNDITPTTSRHVIQMLKRKCQQKDMVIKRFRSKENCQKKK